MADFSVPSSIAATSTWHEITGSSNSNVVATHAASVHVVPNSYSGFAKSITLRMRKQPQTNNPRVWVGLYEVDVNGRPTNRLAYTLNYTEITSSAAEGALYTFALSNGLTNGLAPALVSGAKFAIVVHCQSGAVRVARASAPATASFYTKQQSSAPMSNPWGIGGSSSTAAPFCGQVTFEQSTAPTATLTSPLSATTVSPTFTGTFTDANATDRISAFRVEIRLQGTSTLIPGSGEQIVASASDASTNTFTYVWTGTPLEENKAHEWRAQVADRTGIWSAWTAWQAVSVAPSGVVIVSNASPFGKLESWPPANFTAQWTHISAYAMSKFQVRILRGGSVFVEGAEVSVGSVANNAVVQVATSSLSLGTLGPGSYTWQARGYASTQNAWGGWSDERAFVVNAPPNKAVALYPTNDLATGIRPTLRWRVLDPDEDDVTGIGVAAQVEITRYDNSVVYIPALNNVDPANFLYTTSDAANGEMYYQTTETDVPTVGPGGQGRYKWRVRGYDISGNVYGDWSNETSFIFAGAPSISLEQPSHNSTISTSTPLVSWSVSIDESVAYQISVYRQSTTTSPVYTSGRVNSSGNEKSVNIPGGYLTANRTYDLYVTVWGKGGLSTTTPRVTFTVAYPDADALGGVAVSLAKKRRDYEAATPNITWVNGNVNHFVGYAIRRRTSTDETLVPVAFITSQQTTSWYDHAAPANTQLTYEVSRLVRVGSDVRESPREVVAVDVPLTVPTLGSVTDGNNLYAAVMWLSDGFSGGFERPESTYVTWGGNGAPTVISTPESYGKHTVSLNITVRTDARGSMDEHYADFLAIVTSGHPLVFRSEDSRLFCRVVSFSWQRGGTPGTRTITLALEEIAWDESVIIPT